MEAAQMIQILLAAATLILVWVVYTQLRMGKEGLRFQQSGLRRQVFDAMQKFIANVDQEGRVSQEDLIRYLPQTKWADFLFDKRRRDLVEEVYRKGNELLFATRMREKATDDDEFSSYLEREHELLEWFTSGRLSKIEEEFRDYLELK